MFRVNAYARIERSHETPFQREIPWGLNPVPPACQITVFADRDHIFLP